VILLLWPYALHASPPPHPHAAALPSCHLTPFSASLSCHHRSVGALSLLSPLLEFSIGAEMRGKVRLMLTANHSAETARLTVARANYLRLGTGFMSSSSRPPPRIMSNGFPASRIIRSCPRICASRQPRPALYLLSHRNYSIAKRQGYPRPAASIEMGENTNGEEPPVPADASRGADSLSTLPDPRKLKILMLHGKAALP
jgi:hypothetical protein